MALPSICLDCQVPFGRSQWHQCNGYIRSKYRPGLCDWCFRLREERERRHQERTIKLQKLAIEEGREFSDADFSRGGADSGVYIIRGRGNIRYVGEAKSFKARRPLERRLKIARLIKRMPGSTQLERKQAEAEISERLRVKGKTVINFYYFPA